MASADAVIRVSVGANSNARSAVMIFVVLAGERRSSGLREAKSRPVTGSTRIQAAAESSGPWGNMGTGDGTVAAKGDKMEKHVKATTRMRKHVLFNQRPNACAISFSPIRYFLPVSYTHLRAH